MYVLIYKYIHIYGEERKGRRRETETKTNTYPFFPATITIHNP